MASFDWRQAPIDAERRFDGWQGEPAWRALTLSLAVLQQGWLTAFDDFLRATRALKPSPSPKTCRVFVSHQRNDVLFAENIAWLADQHRFEYWLDVHDPILRLANSISLPPQVQSILVAAVIEMALLNCTHMISVQTANAATSRWVPYEFGRGKEHALVSSQAASWFDKGVTPVRSADYLHLGECLDSKAEVITWLTTQARSTSCHPVLPSWTGPIPKQLVN